MMADDRYAHQPVLVEEVLEALNVMPAGSYVDATFGRGGHADALLQRLGPDGRLLAIDRDPEAVRHARQSIHDRRFSVVHASFSSLEAICEQHALDGCLNGILFDLGVSSPQLDDAGRGFSFRSDGPLDMRMNPDEGVSAAVWLAGVGEQELERIIREYGEERFARRIARAVVRARRDEPIVTTAQLAAVVTAAVPRTEPGKDPATRTFQALRIRINHELDELRAGLEQALNVLATGGRLAVISFHSLEDRIVKRFIRSGSSAPSLLRGLPVTASEFRPRWRAIGRVIRPRAGETRDNPRARSARLRVAEKLH